MKKYILRGSLVVLLALILSPSSLANEPCCWLGYCETLIANTTIECIPIWDSADVVNEPKDLTPPPVRLEQATDGFSVTGQLDGASLVDFTAFSEDEKKYIATGNACILSKLMSIYYSFYRIKPLDWDEFRATPLMRNIILYNPYSGKPIELSETFSPGDLKGFGYDENGTYGFCFYDIENDGQPGAAASIEFIPGEKTYFDIFFQPGSPNRMPESDIEWDWYFVGFVMNQLVYRYGDMPGNLTSDAAQLCYRVLPTDILIFSIKEPGGSGKILTMDGVANPLSLTIKVYPGYGSLVFNVKGSDGTSLMKLECGTQDPHTARIPPMD